MAVARSPAETPDVSDALPKNRGWLATNQALRSNISLLVTRHNCQK
jgi:hypothetical protein